MWLTFFTLNTICFIEIASPPSLWLFLVIRISIVSYISLIPLRLFNRSIGPIHKFCSRVLVNIVSTHTFIMHWVENRSKSFHWSLKFIGGLFVRLFEHFQSLFELNYIETLICVKITYLKCFRNCLFLLKDLIHPFPTIWMCYIIYILTHFICL